MRKVVCVTVGEDRLPAGVAEQIREFADFRAARCETPEDLLRTFPDAEVQWMFGPNLCLKPEALARMMSGFLARSHNSPIPSTRSTRSTWSNHPLPTSDSLLFRARSHNSSIPSALSASLNLCVR